jgi:hypothetical protein
MNKDINKYLNDLGSKVSEGEYPFFRDCPYVPKDGN